MKPFAFCVVLLTGLLNGCGQHSEKSSPASETKGGKADAQSLLQRGLSLLKEGNSTDAAKLIEAAAAQNLPEAQNQLGSMYARGIGVIQDDREAFKWFRKAAEQGEPKAQNSLGTFYTRGWGVETNVAEGLKWLRKSVEQGDGDACINLARSYFRGEGVPSDDKEGWRLAKKGAELGSSEAQYSLWSGHLQGQIVPKDEQEALRWLKKAAEQGHQAAQFNLGMAFSQGVSGVEQNYVEAVRWYKLAADQGFPHAQYNLGRMYSKGIGIAQNYAEAFAWCKKAAEQGLETAQLAVGLMYSEGQGVPQDLIEAYKWLKLSSSQNYSRAEEFLRDVTAKLTDGEIATAQQRVKEFQVSKTKLRVLPSGFSRVQNWSDGLKVVRPNSAPNVKNKLRYDGIYSYSPPKSKWYTHYRFYSDGSAVSIEGGGSPDNAVKFLSKTLSIASRFRYTVDGSLIEISDEKNSIKGEVAENAVILYDRGPHLRHEFRPDK